VIKTKKKYKNPPLNTHNLMTRNGKIARLPHDVREELNVRLERSEPSPQLLAWLNAMPVVRAFVQREAHKANRDNFAVETAAGKAGGRELQSGSVAPRRSQSQRLFGERLGSENASQKPGCTPAYPPTALDLP
jgi:hypothetical protein